MAKESNELIAKIIVDVKNENVDTAFDYLIPEELLDIVNVGSRVFVEFGLRKVLGYVIQISPEVNYPGKLKPILEVLDFGQNLTIEQVKLAEYLQRNSNSFYISCLEVMLPSFLKAKYRKTLQVHDFKNLDANLAVVLKNRRKVEINDEIIKHWPLIKAALSTGKLSIDYGYSTYGSKRYTKYYLPTKEVYRQDLNQLTSKRFDCLNYCLQNEKVTLEDIVSNVGCSEYLVKDLVKKGFLKVVNELVIDEIVKRELSLQDVKYNLEQENLIYKYKSLENKPFLFITNDDDFRWNFLIDCIIEAVNQNKQVLVLTPTILQNSETTLILKKRLKKARIASLASNLKNSEYYENYLNIKAGNVDILVCTKVGIFSPLENIGLIIVFDEDNLNYINEQNPRFSSIDVLKFRRHYHQAKMILASISPSINSYYQAYLSKYYLLKYWENKKVNAMIVNMKEEMIQSGQRIISKELEKSLQKVLQDNTQAILILNRKAYSSFIRCSHCGETEKCPHCQINLSYYQKSNEYRCVYCNYSVPSTNLCSTCKTKALDYLGFGLEQVVEILQEKFPTARILLIDASQVSKNFEDIMMAIEENVVDFIVGTSIINSSLKNDKINLVSLVDVDSALNIDDYRSSELTYNQIVKLINRDNTKVIIQGFNPTHYAIKMALINDYEVFYQTEIKNRELLNYEPFININRLIIIGQFKPMYHYANYFKKVFTRVIKKPSDILGPVYLPKFRGVQLILKHNDDEKVIKLIKDISDTFKDQQLNVIFEKYPTSFK